MTVKSAKRKKIHNKSAILELFHIVFHFKTNHRISITKRRLLGDESSGIQCLDQSVVTLSGDLSRTCTRTRTCIHLCACTHECGGSVLCGQKNSEIISYQRPTQFPGGLGWLQRARRDEQKMHSRSQTLNPHIGWTVSSSKSNTVFNWSWWKLCLINDCN